MGMSRSVVKHGELEVDTRLLASRSFKSFSGLTDTIGVLQRAIPILRRHLSVSKDLTVVLRPIKDGVQGQWCLDIGPVTKEWIEIDPRRPSIALIVETLCHEFVHAEQYHTGKLSMRKEGPVWMGSLYQYETSHTTYDQYRDQPWEKEAYDREQPLAHFVMDMIASNT